MIVKTRRKHSGIAAGQRISYFKVGLAAGDLPDVAPRWHRVVDRIIEPLTEFMAQDGNVSHILSQQSAISVAAKGIGLKHAWGNLNRRMVAKEEPASGSVLGPIPN